VVTEDQNLEVLGGVTPGEQGEQLDGAAQREIGEFRQHQMTSEMGDRSATLASRSRRARAAQRPHPKFASPTRYWDMTSTLRLPSAPGWPLWPERVIRPAHMQRSCLPCGWSKESCTGEPTGRSTSRLSWWRSDAGATYASLLPVWPFLRLGWRPPQRLRVATSSAPPTSTPRSARCPTRRSPASAPPSNCYYGGGQRVWPLRRLTCTGAEMASPQLIAPVITTGHRTSGNTQLQRAVSFYRKAWATAYLRQAEALLAASA
jgi:hypothetical protein